MNELETTTVAIGGVEREAETVREWLAGNREALLRAVSFLDTSPYKARTDRIRKEADTVPSGSVWAELSNLENPGSPQSCKAIDLPPLVEVVDRGESKTDPNEYTLTEAGQTVIDEVLPGDVPSGRDVDDNTTRVEALTDQVSELRDRLDEVEREAASASGGSSVDWDDSREDDPETRLAKVEAQNKALRAALSTVVADRLDADPSDVMVSLRADSGIKVHGEEWSPSQSD